MNVMGHIPHYRDPIVRNVARLLLRSLQEQHRAPSNTIIELEARLGEMVAAVSHRRSEIPLATATAAIVDSSQQHLCSFTAGVAPTIASGIQLGMIEKGIASRLDFQHNQMQYESQDVHIILPDGRRIHCAYGHIAAMEAKMKHRNSSAQTAAPSARRGRGIVNPCSFTSAIHPLSATTKKRIAGFDVVCPGWCADVRLSIAEEAAADFTVGEVAKTLPHVVRHRNRGVFAVSPFLSIHLSRTVASSKLDWHPSRWQCEHEYDEAQPLIPVPDLHVPFRSLSSRSGNRWTGSAALGERSRVDEVEVEVNVPALLRAWKKIYGGAAASAYLSTAELVGTTAAGTCMDATAAAELASSTESVTVAHLRAFMLSEREDPFLLRVAEDYLALLQFVGAVRVFE